MKNTIVIQCTDAFEKADVTILDLNGRIDVRENIPVDTLASSVPLTDADIIVYLATPEIMLKDVIVPSGVSGSALQKIIPNIIEDNLVSNIDLMQFVYKKLGKNHYSVGWVEKERLSQWMALLLQNQIRPTALYPMALGMMADTTIWRIWIKDKKATIKISATEGFTFDVSMLPSMLNMIYEAQTQRPDEIIISSAELHTDIEDALKEFPEIRARCQFQTLPSYPIFSADNLELNLLENVANTNATQRKRYVKHVAIASGLLILFFLVQEGMYVRKYAEIDKQQTAEIKSMYLRVYPQATQVTSPKARIEQELKNLGGYSPFFELLYSTGMILLENPQILLKDLYYGHDRLKITLEAPTYAELERLIQQIKSKQYKVEQSKAEQLNNKLIAQITIFKDL